ncbi:MAG: 2-oxo-4-hydroxy-4-carboxy-5-ureidoimidazoline decarboxylase [Gammaproteobacteria bacterium]
MQIEEFNKLPRHQALAMLMQCCNASRWAQEMVECRPFASLSALQVSSQTIWAEMREQDFLEAFDGHPKIGDPDSLKLKYNTTKEIASSEQSGIQHASDQIIDELASYNQAYLDKFGFIFIVCATGKTANEMLTSIKRRLSNRRQQELALAANEQQKITTIRINKLFEHN